MASIPFWAAAPKGPLTYAFTQEKFLLLLLLQCTPPPQGPNPSFEAQIPQGWDLGLDGIWASRFRFEPQRFKSALKGVDGGEDEEEEGEGEISPV